MIDRYVPKGSTFLEIGCASGDFGISLAKKGYSGLMIDFSSEASDEVTRNLKEKGITNIRFEKKDFFEIEAEKKFDLITMFEVLEHIKDDRNALKKINSLLKEGGMFLLSVPAEAKLWGPNDILAGHIRRYEKKELISLLNESGFKIVEFFSYGYPWLNIIKYFRDSVADRKLKKKKVKSKILLTKASGLNPTAIKVPLLRLFFNKYFLFLPIKISNLFNNMDLAEGYLCLAKKRSTAELKYATVHKTRRKGRVGC